MLTTSDWWWLRAGPALRPAGGDLPGEAVESGRATPVPARLDQRKPLAGRIDRDVVHAVLLDHHTNRNTP